MVAGSGPTVQAMDIVYESFKPWSSRIRQDENMGRILRSSNNQIKTAPPALLKTRGGWGRRAHATRDVARAGSEIFPLRSRIQQKGLINLSTAFHIKSTEEPLLHPTLGDYLFQLKPVCCSVDMPNFTLQLNPVHLSKDANCGPTIFI
jgi:hypothetical protein